MSNAIRAMMDEQDENNDATEDASDDAEGYSPSPLTEGYHVVTGSVDLLRDIAMEYAQQAGHDVDSPSEVTGNFNPRNHEDAIDKAAREAMSQSVFDEPVAIVGLMGAMEALKVRLGGQHPEKVSGEGHHGSGLNTDGKYAKARDGSYGEAYPEAPHFDQLVGVETLDGGERDFLKENLDIPVSEIGVAGPVLLPAPEGERIPIGFTEEGAEEAGYEGTLDHLAAVTDRLEAMPEIPGPDGFEGEAVEATGEVTSDDTSDVERDDLPMDEVPFDDLWDMTVNEFKGEATSIESEETLDALATIEEANPSYDEEVEVRGKTFEGGRKGILDRIEERRNGITSDDGEGVDEEADAEGSDDDGDSGSVEASGDMSRLEYETKLVANGLSVEEAEEKADERFA